METAVDTFYEKKQPTSACASRFSRGDRLSLSGFPFVWQWVGLRIELPVTNTTQAADIPATLKSMGG